MNIEKLELPLAVQAEALKESCRHCPEILRVVRLFPLFKQDTQSLVEDVNRMCTGRSKEDTCGYIC